MDETADKAGRPRFSRKVPEGDSLPRDVCERCGFVAYENPKIVAGAVVRAGEDILLCRRAIEPRRGFWTIPAGYLELGETPAAGAAREAREEACAEIDLSELLAVYTIPRLSQVQLIYRARLSGDFAAGEETLETALFPFARVPWADIAFPSVVWALTHDEAVREGRAAGPFHNPADADGDLARFAARRS